MSEKTDSITIDGITITYVEKKSSQQSYNIHTHNNSMFKKFLGTLKRLKNSFYIKVRNLADPLDDKDLEGGGKSAVEGGLKMTF